MKTLICIVFLLISICGYGQINQKFGEIAFDDFKIYDDTTYAGTYLNDQTKVDYSYIAKSNYQAGAHDEYFSLKLYRQFRFRLNHTNKTDTLQFVILRYGNDSLNINPEGLAISGYFVENDKLNKVKIKKDNYEIIKEKTDYYLKLNTRKLNYTKLIIECKYFFRLPDKRKLFWVVDSIFPIHNCTFKISIPEIYNYTMTCNSDSNVMITPKYSMEGPSIGYRLTYGSTNTNFTLYPQIWVDNDKKLKANRGYTKEYLKLYVNEYEYNWTKYSKKTTELINFSLININEIKERF